MFPKLSKVFQSIKSVDCKESFIEIDFATWSPKGVVILRKVVS